MFPARPERTRLFGLLASQRAWPEEFLAPPSVLGVVDSSGIELLPPMRAGRSRQHIGRTGNSHPRWSGGGKPCRLLHQGGVVVGWDCAGAHAPATAFQPLSAPSEDEMSVRSDAAVQAKEGDPTNLQRCERGLWNTRRLVEPVLSLLHGICRLTKVAHRTWAAFHMRLAFTLATLNLLVHWHGRKSDAPGFIRLSFAEVSL